VELREESVRRETVFEAPVEEVWAAVTDPDRLAEWFANEVEIDWRAGGEGTFRWANGEERRAVVHEVLPGERLAFTWLAEDGAASTVELELHEVDGGTRLVVTETSATAGAAPVAEWSAAVGLGALARHLDPVLV
jgi:uncharacterized protein YndB with AHSA1/START domain